MEENKVLNQQEEEFIVVSDGKRSIPIRNQLGEQIGVFRYNPTDINMINRYNEIAGKFEEVTKPLERAGITKDGEGEDDVSIEIVNEVEENLIELMDYMLDGNSREAFFSVTHALTPVGGEFYFEKVFDAIGSFLEAKFESEFKAMGSRIEKHTHGYRTGRHKKGDR